MRGSPWASFELENERVLELNEASAVVAYKATARRDAVSTPRCSTAPTSEGDSWRMALHQQTPI
jgi:hypothetical protein